MARAYFAALFLAFCSTQSWAKECTQKDAQLADAKAAYLKDWSQVYGAYRRFGHCDDGSISAGFTESVTVLLARMWESLPQLADRIGKDKNFAKFTLRHISASAAPDNLSRIARNAESRCPSGQKRLCAAIGARAKEAQR